MHTLYTDPNFVYHVSISGNGYSWSDLQSNLAYMYSDDVE